MKKKEALAYIIEIKGFVPYIGVFDIFDEDRDEIPQELIDITCAKDKPSCNYKVINSGITELLNSINKL